MRGAITQLGIRFMAEAVVLTAGTFLNGKIHVGLENYTGGRMGDPAAVSRITSYNVCYTKLLRPAHDTRDWEFAKEFNLPIIEVLKGGEA